MLIVYEPIDRFGRMSEYWRNYISFYEEYWGGPTSPYGVWFGNDYNDFRTRLSDFLGVEEDGIQDCLFMKGSLGDYLISPLRSFKNDYILDSDNCIPAHWFIPFRDEERKFFYTHLGFGRIHYGADVMKCIARIDEADGIIGDVTTEFADSENDSALFMKLKKIQSDIYELKAWLSEFDPSGYVVLDYGELCSFLSPYSLNIDHSSRDIWSILENLKNNNMEESRQALNSIFQKWETVKQQVSTAALKNDLQ